MKNWLMSVAAGVVMLGLVSGAWAKFDEGRINVDFGNKDEVQTGKAVVGEEGDKWNAPEFAVAEKFEVIDAKGAKTEVTVSYAGEANWDAGADAAFAGTSFQKLMQDYLFTHEARKITLQGLTANKKYDLYVYCAADQNGNGRKTKFTVGKESKTVEFAADKKEFKDGVNYVKFEVQANEKGEIVITYEGANEGDNPEGNCNGFQLVAKK